MSKNVLIISSSFRHDGNSEILAESFMNGAQAAGHKTECLLLQEHEIHFCLGCEACANTGKCIQKDDMNEIMEKMLAADVIVLATPTYFYSMSGQMKTLIDRTVPIYEKLQHKDFYYIITAADTEKANVEPVVTALRGYTEMCLENCREAGILYAVGLWKRGEAAQSRYMQEAYEMGRNC